MKTKQINIPVFSLTILLLYILSCGTNAQITDSTSIYYLESIDEAKAVITQNRDALYQLLRRRNIEKIDLLLNKKIELKSQIFEIYYPKEINLIHILTGNYNAVLTDVSNGNDFHNDSIEYNLGKQYLLIAEYGDDDLLKNLIELCSNDSDLTQQKIDNSDLDPEKKEFLHIYFKAIAAYNNLETFSKDSINQSSEAFYNNFPGSVYNPYISKYIDYKYKTSSFGFGFGLYSGYHLFTDSLQSKFGHSIPIGATLSMSYRRFELVLNFAGSIGAKTREGFDYDDYWKKDLSVSISTGELNLGYALIDNKRIRTTPYVGIYSTNISVNNYEQNDSLNLSVKYFPSYTFGVSFDYKIGYFNKVVSSYRDRFMVEAEKTYWFVRFRVGYNNPMLDKESNQFSGSNIYFNLGLGFYTNPAKRIKKYKN